MMRPLFLPTLALALASGLVAYAPAAHAGHVVVGVGLTVPGVAVWAPAPVVVAPAPIYYGPRFYAPYVVTPVSGWHARYWGPYRPYRVHRGWR